MTDTVLKNNKIKAMVFDMDGTLLDTEHQYIEGYLKLAQERGLNMDKKFPYTCMGLPREMVRKRYRDTFGADFDFEGFRAEMINRVHTLWQNEGIAIKPGVVEFLDYCDNNGILCAVATSTTRNSAEMMLKTTNLFDRFGAVVCGDEIENGKPNPDIFITAAKRLGVNPRDCGGAEDSRSGITAVHRAEMTAFFVVDTLDADDEIKTTADFVCADMFEVMNLVDKINKNI